MSGVPPPPPTPSPRSYRSISGGSGGSVRSTVSAGSSSLPPPPPIMGGHHHQQQQSHANLSASPLSRATSASSQQSQQQQPSSMTIDEMRHLHRRALQEAEAKRTELRLVLASRYRELVGSSDEVLRMKERAKELHNLIHALPALVVKLQNSSASASATTTNDEGKEGEDEATALATNKQKDSLLATRRQFSELTRSVHRALDRHQVHLATTTLIRLFCLFASHTNEYPLANTLAQQQQASSSSTVEPPTAEQMAALDPTLRAQMRMIFYQVQTLPRTIAKSSHDILLQAASYASDGDDDSLDPAMGAERSAAALASLDLLSTTTQRSTAVGDDRATFLLDTYFDSKAQLLGSLFNQLTVQASDQAEGILTKIVLILQHDVIVHPYEIFVKRQFPGNAALTIMETLPLFDPAAVKAKCSKFLATHLSLIRTKVKSVLVSIAGTTASALGQIRQSLYDKTDGNECQKALNENNPFCSWDEAVASIVDVRQVATHSEVAAAAASPAATDRKFSLWSALFSHTFSSLVHSLLTTSFHSVHAKVVSTLRTSLSQAPPLAHLLPHEAHRNTLRMAVDLDQALLQVSDDAHELLVHAEERQESERRLRQSLYVQTCEILGRLLCEVRRLVVVQQGSSADGGGARELIVGRLCHVLKFRLESLPTLLDPQVVASPAHGMISHVDLESAFALADDNSDGLISFPEALDATESAFSGTQFHGSEMLRGTLLLSSSASSTSSSSGPTKATALGKEEDQLDVTLSELMLLTARGLRHGTGQYSALGMVQKALDDIVNTCFEKWADAALHPALQSLSAKASEFVATATTTASDAEWQTFHGGSASSSSSSPVEGVVGVSPPTVGFVMSASFTMNRTTTPADALSPVRSPEQAAALGILQPTVPSLTDTLRWTLLRRAASSYCGAWNEALTKLEADKQANATAMIQLYVDVTFVKFCFLERNQHGFGTEASAPSPNAQEVEDLVVKADKLMSKSASRAALLSLPAKVKETHQHVNEVCDLFFSSLFGNQPAPSAIGGGELDLGGASSSSTTQPFCYTPLASSRRFVLLPIQTDRSLADLQLKGAYRKEKEEQERNKESIGGSVMSSGLGFFSSMLKKK